MLKEALYTAKRPYHLVKTGLLNGLPAAIKYRFPARKLHISAITGTDGKTTSSTLLYHVLKNSGYKAGLLSTVAAYIGNEEIDTGFHVTSPQPSDLQNFMRCLVDQGYTHLVMEVTSHGSYQYRTWGVKPELAGITNVAHEHLDYHLTYQRYLKAKADVLKPAPTIVLNEQDNSYLKLKKEIGFNHTLLTYSMDMNLPKKISAAIEKRFPETYNQLNARLVYQLAKTLGVGDDSFAAAIETFPGIPGRMEYIKTRRRFDVIIDFAHTPQGLKAALTSVRDKHKKTKLSGRIIAVFGCAGLRDFAKRPMMGKIAVELADLTVFTAEDPRTENVWSIIRQMKEQLPANHNKVISIADRREAIHFAINKLAASGDTVIILGKGHEKSICYGTTEYPWSDRAVAEEALG
jgi:UDP-N-acetylmuramoyl-L-alanyl-D-glutamate--2,6-diaminopimelate ligase